MELVFTYRVSLGIWEQQLLLRLRAEPSSSGTPSSNLAEKRLTGTNLTQLRSGFCGRLNDFLLRIGRVDSDIFPDCRSAPASSHPFISPANHTNLTMGALWEQPWDTAHHLASFPGHLPATGPPPPCPGRQEGLHQSRPLKCVFA